ncbi:hypothetical protein C1752_09127 [Acaryochloris thomasi RCC1774]|uniref:Transposase Synechocystis PCC 6803 domain-containing protein n=1 Tax=Acaryochloris thomasi RCC1774 TaxID=1764569 RepID=A0A2W1JKR2_9CYAN|nr:hypothetical protein C1752_09127 [Acaryochloris thomasi RCC1774]
MPYSYNLRRKAIDAINSGQRKVDVCRILNISRNTLHLWLQRAESIGDGQAITNYQQGNRHKITDWPRFREFAQQHCDKTQSPMAALWGESVTQQNISDAFHKIGFTRKKRPMVIKNKMKSNAKPL